MVIKSNSVRDINVALLELERRIKTNKDEGDGTLQEAVNYVKKYLNKHLNDGTTYNINISGNANTADYAISAGTSNYATSAGSAQSADTANNATHANTADYATAAGSASIVFPEGFVYIQLNGKSNPAQMGMSVPDGCAWVDISADYASFPYIKIGSGTTQNGQVLNHTHGMQHHHSMQHRHSGTTGGAKLNSGLNVDSIGFWYRTGSSGSPSVFNLTSTNYSLASTINHTHDFTTSNNTGNYADTSDQESRFTSGAYSGTGTGTDGKTATDGNNISNTTNEVNATYAIVWEVQRI